jgi:hypothetical protein
MPLKIGYVAPVAFVRLVWKEPPRHSQASTDLERSQEPHFYEIAYVPNIAMLH